MWNYSSFYSFVFLNHFYYVSNPKEMLTYILSHTPNVQSSGYLISAWATLYLFQQTVLFLNPSIERKVSFLLRTINVHSITHLVWVWTNLSNQLLFRKPSIFHSACYFMKNEWHSGSANKSENLKNYVYIFWITRKYFIVRWNTFYWSVFCSSSWATSSIII